jgi:hypothetical protein
LFGGAAQAMLDAFAVRLGARLVVSRSSFEEDDDYWKDPAKRRGCIGGLT